MSCNMYQQIEDVLKLETDCLHFSFWSNMCLHSSKPIPQRATTTWPAQPAGAGAGWHGTDWSSVDAEMERLWVVKGPLKAPVQRCDRDLLRWWWWWWWWNHYLDTWTVLPVQMRNWLGPTILLVAWLCFWFWQVHRMPWGSFKHTWHGMSWCLPPTINNQTTMNESSQLHSEAFLRGFCAKAKVAWYSWASFIQTRFLRMNMSVLRLRCMVCDCKEVRFKTVVAQHP